MERPVASPAAEELYAALDPALTVYDEANEWIALKLMMALVAGSIDQLHGYLIDDVDDLGQWEPIFDPATCPVEALPYLAQFAGAIIRPNMDTESRRNAIDAPEAFSRGRPASVEAVARRRLTGTQTVILTERYTDNAWRLRIETIEAETPEPAETEREIEEEQKPIGILLFFNTRIAWTWGEVETESATYPTWQSIAEAFDTWEEFYAHEP